MKSIRIHTFLHVAYEGLGCIEQWIISHNHALTFTRFYEPYKLPSSCDIDWLIVMGGPMSVYEEDRYPWLKDEKSLIREMITSGKTVIGICLGSQLIAEVLGANVYPNHKKEIGWFDVKLTDAGKSTSFIKGFESQFTVFHWHGDTYSLPHDTEHLYFTEICSNQAFLYKNRVLGLQFHFEVTADTLKGMVDNGKAELIPSETIQSADKILSNSQFIEENNLKMFQLLDNLAQ